MANASSRARAVYNQNTAVLYYEPSESADNAPVSTARVVPVGATAAAHGGTTLQLVDGARPPQVVEVAPPQAAARKRPAGKQPTRVIAYNVRIVAGEVPDQAPSYVQDQETPAEMPERGFEAAQSGADEQFDIRGRSHRYRELELNLHPSAHRRPQNVQFESPAAHAAFDMPREPRERMRFEMPENTRSPRAQMPLSFFGALENAGGILHEHSRAAAGSYKQLIAQHLSAGNGPLLSNRNLSIAVGAYALILLLLALFTS